jgi:hypothetical protein
VGPGVSRPETSLLDTISESLFGDAYAEENWRPVALRTFFSDGWREAWASGPAGQSGLTPRHGWLGSFEGVFYRLWVVSLTYENDLTRTHGGNSYSGDLTIFLPFSRRFEMLLGVPFISASRAQDARHGYVSDFGDLSVGARFLLSETEAFSQTFNLGVIVPTGQKETGGGLMSLFPRYSFWSNPGGAWVVRGGTGVSVPLNQHSHSLVSSVAPSGRLLFGDSISPTSYAADLAIGRYLRPHDVPLGDLVVYANCNLIVPLDGGGRPTYAGIGPGTRFQIANDWFFLSYWEFPLVGHKPFDYQAQFAILRIF